MSRKSCKGKMGCPQIVLVLVNLWEEKKGRKEETCDLFLQLSVSLNAQNPSLLFPNFALCPLPPLLIPFLLLPIFIFIIIISIQTWNIPSKLLVLRFKIRVYTLSNFFFPLKIDVQINCLYVDINHDYLSMSTT